MNKLRVLDLFSGIGGFSLGLERTGGFETVAFCEIEPFPRRVLAKHWPEVPIYEDVRTLTKARLDADGITGIDVITGGFPCQDLSVAGKQAGMGEGTRSGLWSEITRLVGEIRPNLVIVENVPNLLSGPSVRPGGWFGRVLGDLAALGYDAEWHCIPAGRLGSPHIRDRVWIVAYTDSWRRGQSLPQGTTPTGQTPDGRKQTVCLERYLNQIVNGIWPLPFLPTITVNDGGNITAPKSQFQRDTPGLPVRLAMTAGERLGLASLRTFAEWMMGYEIGWTRLPSPPSATPLSRKSPN